MRPPGDLDMLIGARVDRNMDALACTRVVIAHRVSTIQNSDLILVLEGGAAAEQGSHRQLLAPSGYYAALYRVNLRKSAELSAKHLVSRAAHPQNEKVLVCVASLDAQPRR